VNYAVAANTSGARSGTITIAGLAFIVTQAGTSCSYSITLGNMTSAAGGFDGTVKVVTTTSCSWTAASNVSWISVISGSATTGTGATNFFVANNPNSTTRVGDLTVAGYVIQVTEGPKGEIKLEKPVR
jgi:hypothetical protein